MFEYHKIETVFRRNPLNKNKTLIEGEYSKEEFLYLANNKWIGTEKVNGTNIRVHVGADIKFGGKTMNAQISTFLYDKLNELFPYDKVKEALPDGEIVLYGEGYGAKIQKGGGDYISDGCNFILFDILIGGWWLNRKNVVDIAHKLGIYVVPVVYIGTLDEGIERVRKGFTSELGNCTAEGLVMRPVVELFDRSKQRIITKIKYKDFKRD